jgi:hypothetical protein
MDAIDQTPAPAKESRIGAFGQGASHVSDYAQRKAARQSAQSWADDDLDEEHDYS